MSKQIYFEDIEEGMDIPTLRKDPTTQQLVKYLVSLVMKSTLNRCAPATGLR